MNQGFCGGCCGFDAEPILMNREKKNRPVVFQSDKVTKEGSLQKIQYETHHLEDKELPFIFHLDTVRGSEEFFNWHDNIEVLYCVEGSGTIFCNSAEYRIQKGDIAVINSNYLHGASSDNALKYYCLIVDLGFLEENKLPMDHVELNCHVVAYEARRLYEAVVKEIQRNDPYREAGIRTAVLQLMVYLCRYFSTAKEENGRTDTDIHTSIKTAIGYVKAHYAEKLTLEEVAEQVGLSKYYFAREFKEATGMTLVTFINTYRCRNAIKLLSKKHCSIHEAAQKCGFENDSYFSKTFKNLMGYLPSEHVSE